MTTDSPAIDPLAVRTAFGRAVLQAPEPVTGGWRLHASYAGGPLITLSEYVDHTGHRRTLASISRNDRLPDPADVELLKRTVFGAEPVDVATTLPTSIEGLHQNAVYLLGPVRDLPSTA